MSKPSAVVIPYYTRDTEIFVFLQMRDGNAREDKNVFSLFGGQMDTDTDPRVAVLREMREEFSHPPVLGEKLGLFKNFAGGDMYVFLAPVSSTFGDETKVLEGQYGQFLTIKETLERDDVSQIVPPVLKALEAHLLNHP